MSLTQIEQMKLDILFKFTPMTTLQLQTDISQSLEAIGHDSSLLERAARYLKRLARQATSDEATMSKDEFFARIDRALEQESRGEGIVIDSRESLHQYLSNL